MDQQTDSGVQAPETQDTGATSATNDYNFSDYLDPGYKDHPSITKFNGDINNLAKSYLSLEQIMGQEKIAIPKAADDKVTWDMFDKAMGVPDADKYDLQQDPDFEYDMASFGKLMKENHIPKAAAQNLLNAYAADMKRISDEVVSMQDQARENTIQALKNEWGARYGENMTLANNTLVNFCENQDEYEHIRLLVGNDAAAIKFLNKVGSALSEGNIGGFEGQVKGFSKTPAEAKAEFDRIMADPEDAYWAGARNRRNDMKWCKENGKSYVSEDERLARVRYVNSLLKMQG